MELNSGTTISFDFRKKKKIKRRGMMNITKEYDEERVMLFE